MLAPRCLTVPSPEGFLTSLRVCFLIYKIRKQYLPADGRTELYVMICLMHNPWLAHNKYSDLSLTFLYLGKGSSFYLKIHFPLLYISIKLVSSNSLFLTFIIRISLAYSIFLLFITLPYYSYNPYKVIFAPVPLCTVKKYIFSIAECLLQLFSVMCKAFTYLLMIYLFMAPTEQ